MNPRPDVAPPASNDEHDGVTVAPARIGTNGCVSMPCVAGIVSDIAMRIWCTNAVAATLVDGPGFATHDRMPELTVRLYQVIGGRFVNSVARCFATASRVSPDGGFVLDVTVREIGLADES